jgi:hypothetical protein
MDVRFRMAGVGSQIPPPSLGSTNAQSGRRDSRGFGPVASRLNLRASNCALSLGSNSATARCDRDPLSPIFVRVRGDPEKRS